MANGNLSSFLNEMNQVTASQESLKNYLDENYTQTIGQALTDMQTSASAIADRMRDIPGLDLFRVQLEGLSTDLGALNSEMKAAVDNADYSGLDGIRSAVNRISENLGSLTDEATLASALLGEHIQNALTRIEQAAGDITEILIAFGDGLKGVTYKLSALSSAMINIQSGVLDAKSELQNARAKLLELADFLDALAGSEFLKEAIEVLSSGGDLLDTHLASPLKVSDEVFYPAEPYGTQMSRALCSVPELCHATGDYHGGRCSALC